MFLLTDGQVNNKNEIVNLIASKCRNDDDTKVFSFGIGNDCSKDLVKKSAEAGKGKSYFTSTSNRDQLKDQVIDAL